MSESKTPRCDLLTFRDGQVGIEFAKELELELSRTREWLKEALEGWSVVINSYREDGDDAADAERISQIRKEAGL